MRLSWIPLRSALLPALFLALISVLFFSGCANNSLVRYETLSKQTASQDFVGAANSIRKDHSMYGSHSELLYNMDLGILYHYAGLYDSSIAHLENAVQIHDDLFTHSVTNEAMSLLTNDNARPYRGHSYEITWVHLFLAFDYIAQKKYDDARVEVRQAQIFLDELRRTAGTNPKAYRDDGLLRTIAATLYEALGEKDDAIISLYQAVKSYREAKEPVPPDLAHCAYTVLTSNGRGDDAKELELQPYTPGPSDPTFGGSEIIVVGEMGRSPRLDQTEFWGTWERDGVLAYYYKDADGHVISQVLPAPGLPQSAYQKNGGRTQSGTTLHVKWTMPALREVPSQTDALRVAVGGGVYGGEAYDDTHDLLKRDLDENYTSTLTRTVIRVVVRTLAEQEAKAKLESGQPLLNLLVDVGADVLSDQLEQADTRVWFLLPRTVQLTRIPVKPGHYSLNIGAEGRGQLLRSENREVDVKAGEKKFVFFTSLK